MAPRSAGRAAVDPAATPEDWEEALADAAPVAASRRGGDPDSGEESGSPGPDGEDDDDDDDDDDDYHSTLDDGEDGEDDDEYGDESDGESEGDGSGGMGNLLTHLGVSSRIGIETLLDIFSQRERRACRQYPALADVAQPFLEDGLSHALRAHASPVSYLAHASPANRPPPCLLADLNAPKRPKAKRLRSTGSQRPPALPPRESAGSAHGTCHVTAPRRSARIAGAVAAHGATPDVARHCAKGQDASPSRSGPLADSRLHVVPPEPNIAHMLRSRECALEGDGGWSRGTKRHVSCVSFPPTQPVRRIEARGAKCYIGKFSQDGTRFVSGYQDSRVRIFDTTRGYKLVKDVEARRLRWTITDTAISPDSRFLLYSTISPHVHLVNMTAATDVVRSIANITEVHQELDFHAGGSERCGIWSLAWSADSTEIVAGTTLPGIAVYDLASERVKCTSRCHQDDVNAVTFLDDGSNVIVSGSDDSHLLVLDRRTMSDGEVRPEGVLLGHTEGITHLHARGDGVYLVSNGKDSTVRMWDVRKMTCDTGVIRNAPVGSLTQFEYRWHDYPLRSSYVTRAVDNSVMTFRGHSVLKTLIRAYWAPVGSTFGRYIYSGSADGTVYMFDTVTGQVAHRLEHHEAPVRDCSWHPHKQELVSVSWDGSIVLWGPSTESDRPIPQSVYVDDWY